MDPFQVPLVIVPTPDKLEVVIDEFKVVPVSVPASAIIDVVAALVNLPLLSTVNVGINVDEP
jgi:hypothetical protein